MEIKQGNGLSGIGQETQMRAKEDDRGLWDVGEPRMEAPSAQEPAMMPATWQEAH